MLSDFYLYGSLSGSDDIYAFGQVSRRGAAPRYVIYFRALGRDYGIAFHTHARVIVCDGIYTRCGREIESYVSFGCLPDIRYGPWHRYC